jgi:hypothetical protein
LTAGAPDHCFLALSVCAAAVGWLVGCCFVGLIGGFSCVGVSCLSLALLELFLSPWRVGDFVSVVGCKYVCMYFFHGHDGCCWLVGWLLLLLVVAGG